LAIEQRDPRISLFYSQSTGLKSLSYDSCNSTLRQNRVYIPTALRASVLYEFHSTHMGMTKMKQLARRHCYWSLIDSDTKLVQSCEKHNIHQKVKTSQNPISSMKTASRKL